MARGEASRVEASLLLAAGNRPLVDGGGLPRRTIPPRALLAVYEEILAAAACLSGDPVATAGQGSR